MFPTTITISGGNSQDNSQMCTVVQAALQRAGFTNVSLDPANYAPVQDETADIVAAMKRLNPDLFDTPLNIEGFCESEYVMDLNALSPENFVPVPEVWNGVSPMTLPPSPIIGYSGQWPSFSGPGSFFSGFFGQRPIY